LNFKSKSTFIRPETSISGWQEHEAFEHLISTLNMLSLRRKRDEKDLKTALQILVDS